MTRQLRICNPLSLASHLFSSSVCGTDHVVRSIVGFETFSWILILLVFLLISCFNISS